MAAFDGELLVGYTPATQPGEVTFISVEDRELAVAARDQAQIARDAAILAAEAAVAPTDAMVAATVGNTGTATGAVLEGRYRRVLSELRALAPGADAAPTINAALATASGTTGGELVLPEGEYDLDTAAIAINGPNIILRGAGVGKTILNVTGNRDGIIVNGTSSTPLPGVVLEGFTIKGTGPGVAYANQRGIYLKWAPGFVIRDVKGIDAGNNNLNVFDCNGGTIERFETASARDFGMLIFRSQHIMVIDPYAHDIGVTGRANQGLQAKNCRGIQFIRPRVENIQGYGIMTRKDPAELGPLGEATAVDEDCLILDAYVKNMLAGGTFSPTSVYLETTTRPIVRGGQFIDSAGGLIGATASPGVVLANIPYMRGAAGAAVSFSGVGMIDYWISDVHGRDCAQGFVMASVGRGRILGSSMLDGTGAGSAFNAAMRVSGTTSGLVVHSCDFSDYKTTHTQKNGIRETDTATGNKYVHCTATGNTTSDSTVLTGSSVTPLP